MAYKLALDLEALRFLLSFVYHWTDHAVETVQIVRLELHAL
jgi:hypothetical protein